MPRDGQIAGAEASGSGWAPLGTHPYPVNAQERANCRYRGPPRARREVRTRERVKEREREGGARIGQELNSEYPVPIDDDYG